MNIYSAVSTILLVASSIRPLNDYMGDRPGDIPFFHLSHHANKIQIAAYIAVFVCFSSPISGTLSMAVTLVSLGAYLLRTLCFIHLDQFFTFQLGIREGHHLITTGPYRYLVHPSYTAHSLSMLSWLYLLNLPWWGSCLGVALLIWSLRVRIPQEESMMYIQFEQDYKVYLSQRYRIIPFLWYYPLPLVCLL